MAYEASCHCGALAVSVEGDIPGDAMDCNCSHCRRKGFLWTAVGGDQYEVTRGKDKMSTYHFHKQVIDHRFCPTCGVQPFAEGKQDGKAMAMINLRCVPEADLGALKIKHVDGASF